MTDLARTRAAAGHNEGAFVHLRQWKRRFGGDTMTSEDYHARWKDVCRRRWLNQVKSRRFDSVLKKRSIDIGKLEEDFSTGEPLQEHLDSVSPMQGCSSPPFDRQDAGLLLPPWNYRSPRRRARQSSVCSSSTSDGSCSSACGSFGEDRSFRALGHASSDGQLLVDEDYSARMDLSWEPNSNERRLHHSEERHSLSEAQLCNALELLDTGEIVCPICKRNPLQHSSSVVWCTCGLHIDTEQESLSMDYIRSQLHEAIEQHGPSCLGQGKFSLNSEPSINLVNLVFHCELCDFFYVVL